jgi:16S rRNA (cytidine1402-2'-O)-methyltransferase
MAGKLYIVPTPVGNLEDMTPRAITVLRSADLILAEDTRTSGILMKHFDIATPMRSHHKFNEHEVLPGLVSQLQGGETIALVTDAGTPGISDPGFMLVRECRRHEIEVETLPGATAFVPAVVNSGLPCERFTFEGFLPAKKGRATRLKELAEEHRTMIFYESPLRLLKTLEQFVETFGCERDASVSREISKVHNTTHNGTLAQLVEYFKANAPRGEIVIVVAGCESAAPVKTDKYAEFKNKNNRTINSAYEKD